MAAAVAAALSLTGLGAVVTAGPARADGGIPIDLDADGYVAVDALGTRMTTFGAEDGAVLVQRFSVWGKFLADSVTLDGLYVDGQTVDVALYEFDDFSRDADGGVSGTQVVRGAVEVEGTGSDDALVVPLDDPAWVPYGDYYLVVTYQDVDGLAGVAVSNDYSPAENGFFFFHPSTATWNSDTYNYGVHVNFTMNAANPITVASTGAAGADGWFVGDVVSHYTCLGEAPECPVPTTTSVDGEHDHTGLTEVEGVYFEWTHRVKRDATPPTLGAEIVPLEDGDPAWGYRVAWTCDDELSGLADPCPDSVYVSGLGDDTKAEETIHDRAGNERTWSIEDLVTQTYAPTVTWVGVERGHTYPHGTTFDVGCEAVSTVPGNQGAAVPCTVGALGSTPDGDGTVTHVATATADDPHGIGGVGTDTVTWYVAAEPTTPKPPVKPEQGKKDTGKKDEKAKKPAKKKLVVKVPGLGKLPTRGGVPVLTHTEAHRLRIVVRRDGKAVKGRPVWLHSVPTNKAGTKGEPRKVLRLTKGKKAGVWFKTLRLSPSWKGEYRKFAIRTKQGQVRTFTIYVA